MSLQYALVLKILLALVTAIVQSLHVMIYRAVDYFS